MRAYRFALVASVLLLVVPGCGSRGLDISQAPGDDVGYPGDGTTVIVGDGKTWVVGGDPGSEDCLDLDGVCVSVGEAKKQKCGDSNVQADVIVVDGKVVEVICYPPKEEGQDIGEVTESSDGKVTVPQNAGHSVITFKPETDGKPTDGDLRLDGEGLAVIGNGVDKTIIGGNLVIASNNAVVRGLTVDGNVDFEKNSNNAALTFCKVTGNLHIKSNGVTVAACTVLGNLKIDGNGIKLVSIAVAGKVEFNSKPEVCRDVVTFEDKNNNGKMDADEQASAVDACKGK